MKKLLLLLLLFVPIAAHAQVSDFAVLPAGGLLVRVNGGNYNNNGTSPIPINSVTLTLPANSTNFVFLQASGIATSNTSGFLAATTPLAVVATGPNFVQTIQDVRVSLPINPGGSSTVTIPATVSGATSGGIPCFTSTTTMGSTAAITVNDAITGGGAGACAQDSGIPVSTGARAGVVTNTAVGVGALSANGAGSDTPETAFGNNALHALTGASGGTNTAFGASALASCVTCQFSVGIGSNAGSGSTSGSATFVGASSCTTATGNNVVCLGTSTSLAAAADTNENVLGYGTTGAGSNATTIGNASVTDTWFGGATGLSRVRGILGQAATLQKNETTSADANVLTYTPIAAAGVYRGCVSISVSAATSGVISWTLSWKDSNGNTQTNVVQDLFQDGTAAPATSFTTSAASNYHFCRELDVDNSATSIVFKWVGGGTTTTKMSASIERLI